MIVTLHRQRHQADCSRYVGAPEKAVLCHQHRRSLSGRLTSQKCYDYIAVTETDVT